MTAIRMLLLLGLAAAAACSPDPASADKEAVLSAVQGETEAAFARDYEAWKTYWVQDAGASKTYINFADSTFSEMVGWEAIDAFVKTYLDEHPEPAPPPAPPAKAEVQLYGKGARVSYEIMDEQFGRKRETRLLEKTEGGWKIAGMHTTIYGFAENSYIGFQSKYRRYGRGFFPQSQRIYVRPNGAGQPDAAGGI